jgi:hypothetical protein
VKTISPGAHRVREPRQFRPIAVGFTGDHDGGRRPLLAGRPLEHGREPLEHAVDAAHALVAELAIRRRHGAHEAHAARHAVEFRGDVAVAGQDQVGPDNPGHVGLEAVLPAELDDVVGLAGVEILGDEGGRRSPCAARVQAGEGPVEFEEDRSEGFDRLEGHGREPEGFGGKPPRDPGLFDSDAAEESGRHFLVEEQRLVALGHAGIDRDAARLGHVYAHRPAGSAAGRHRHSSSFALENAM